MKMTRSLRVGLAAVAVLGLFLAACDRGRITQDNFNKIQVGMTQGEVREILGEPTESSSLDIAGFSGTTSTWRTGDTTITIQFVNHKVVAKQFSKPGQ